MQPMATGQITVPKRRLPSSRAQRRLPAEQHLLLHNVSWAAYEQLLELFDERPIRLSYDRGMLEIMTLSHAHESYGYLLGCLVDVLTEELEIPRKGGRSTTFKRAAQERGLEADNCYWIQHEAQMRGKKEFDAERDPPPDLAIEVDISRSSLNRLPIYAALKVPEVWRFDGKVLQVFRLKSDGEYEACDASPTFPSLPLAEVVRFLQQSDTVDETSLVRSFRAWVREHVLPMWRGIGQPPGPASQPPPGREPRGKKGRR
jgi:Uma2 family endonuclease